MYRTLVLLKKPLEYETDIEVLIKAVADKTGNTYCGLKIGRYGSKKDGFTPVFCMEIEAKGYLFQVTYQTGLGAFSSNSVKGFVKENYHAKIEISSKVADPNMNYFNDFMLICENLERQLGCILIAFNQETKQWEPY